MTRTGDGSLYAHIAAHVPRDGGPGLTTAGYRLPDQEPVPEGQLPWAPGAEAAMLSRHTVGSEAQPYQKRTGELVNASLRGKRGRRARARLYQWAIDGEALKGIPQLLGHLHVSYATTRANGRWGPDRILAIARWLAFEGRHRGPVKLGIALLGLGHDPQDRAKLLILARHDEFADFVCAALATATGDVEGSALAVAQVARGWGRVGAVDWLSATTNPVVQRWLVCRFQYRSSVMDGYNALDAARADLLGQLQRMQGTDQELVDGAVGVMRTLLNARLQGGPAGDIRDCPEAADVLELLFELTASHRAWLEHYLLAHDARTWLLLAGHGDTAVVPEEWRQTLLDQAGQVMARPGWLDMAIRALADPNHPYFFQAEQAAASLGHDTFPALLATLDHGRDPQWQRAAQAAGADRIGQVVERAERRMILPSADEQGATVDFWFRLVIQELPPERPGLGWPLIEAALRSREVDRGYAYRVLDKWGRANWPEAVEPALHARLATLTDPEERYRVADLLASAQ